MARIGLFGGTFDPPHVGHLALAEWARERLRLDRVIFVPAGEPPHKRRDAVSGPAHRLAMTRLAVRGNPAFRVSTLEMRRGGPSFTVDTVRAFARRARGDRLFFLVGADSLDDFRGWHEPDAILALATLAVAGRPGAGSRASRAWAKRRRVLWIGNPDLDVSSSGIRERTRRGLSLRYLVPEPVRAYVARARLYRRGR